MSTTLPRHEMFIGGEWTPGDGAETQEIVNPATGKVIAHVPKGTEKDVDRAVVAARKAFDGGWSDTTHGCAARRCSSSLTRSSSTGTSWRASSRRTSASRWRPPN